jgi:hypothetical protein
MSRELMREIARLNREAKRLQENQTIRMGKALTKHRKKLATKENVYLRKRVSQLEEENATLIETVRRLERLT